MISGIKKDCGVVYFEVEVDFEGISKEVYFVFCLVRAREHNFFAQKHTNETKQNIGKSRHQIVNPFFTRCLVDK